MLHIKYLSEQISTKGNKGFPLLTNTQILQAPWQWKWPVTNTTHMLNINRQTTLCTNPGKGHGFLKRALHSKSIIFNLISHVLFGNIQSFPVCFYSVRVAFSVLSKISKHRDVKCSYWHVHIQICLKWQQHSPGLSKNWAKQNRDGNVIIFRMLA